MHHNEDIEPPEGATEGEIDPHANGPENVPGSHGNIGNGLSAESFSDSKLTYHSGLDAFRYISNDAWRPADAYDDSSVSDRRPDVGKLGNYKNKAEYFKQPLVADYANNTENVFLMIKTGATVLWERLPLHLVTTLTRVPNFAIYADIAATVSGHEVIDILQNVTEKTMNHDQFSMYRRLRHLRDTHGAVSPSETTLTDGWNLDKFKNLPMLLDAYRRSPDSDWFIFMDADTYFMMDNLMDYLNTLDPNDSLYLGSSAMLGDTIFAHGGSGVVLSRRAMELTVGEHPEWVTESEEHALSVCCGDYMVAYMMLKADIKVATGYDYPHVGWKFQGNTQSSLRLHPEVWCQKVVSFHRLEPSDIETLWEYERFLGPERRRDIRYGDIYRDFVAPYIQEEMFGWDSNPQGQSYTKERDEEDKKAHPDEELKTPRPWESVKACKQACNDKKNCLMWRYLPQEESCEIEDVVRLGRPYFPWIKYGDSLDRTDVTSGYMINRIRELRANEFECDVLYGANEEKLKNDEYYEGWYRVKQLEELKQQEQVKKTKENAVLKEQELEREKAANDAKVYDKQVKKEKELDTQKENVNTITNDEPAKQENQELNDQPENKASKSSDKSEKPENE
ncbi:hypothetical protein D0Z00_000514 [Geotrichum galactomycetum]|uniref:Uncharacterized protein n=1 Tax=Geotrichum galactomycetum TaxID=27317 RepID=A0ACB6V9P1_9ASCO|nr:hypothetical protein D0Z00_000514 [Geotrichum candidum]